MVPKIFCCHELFFWNESLDINLLGKDFAGSPSLLDNFSFDNGGFIEALIDF